MNKVVIFTDSCVDLGSKTTKDLGIEVIPLLITIGDKVNKDGIDITQKDIVESVSKHNVFPKTSSVSPMVFVERFKEFYDKGYDILYCGIGSDLSGTYNSALIAAREFEPNRIFLVDSKNLSSGIGTLVLKACKLRDMGKSAKEIEEQLNKITGLVSAKFVVDTLDFIYRGGRCNGAVYFIGKHLKIHPILKVVDGKLIVHKKPRGLISRGWDEMLEEFKNDLPYVDLDNIMITGCQNEDGEAYIEEQIKKMAPKANIRKTQVGCIIASHCGPNTTGILYIKTK